MKRFSDFGRLTGWCCLRRADVSRKQFTLLEEADCIVRLGIRAIDVSKSSDGRRDAMYAE